MAKTKRIWIIISTVIVTVVVTALLPRVPQDPGFHRFADSRGWIGVPNFGNVFSNVLFVLVGAWGFWELGRRRAPGGVRVIFGMLFGGIVLTGFGSAYYHWAPDNERLIWDRIPMTVVFMSLLAATVAEWIDRRAGVWLLGPLVVLGVGSVLVWQSTGDLRMYGWVQYFPMLAIPLILVLFGRSGGLAGLRSLVWVVVWYVVAKVLEHFDIGVYRALGVSGHTLKHVAAAVSTGYLVGVWRERYGVSLLEK